MTDRRTGIQAGQGGAAGVGEEVQHRDGPSRAPDQGTEQIPVDRLLMEQAGVLEAGRGNFEGQLPVLNLPALGKFGEVFPLTAAFAGAVIMGIGAASLAVPGSVPDDLRVRADEGHLSPALQLFSVRGIQQGVVLPIGCNAHTGTPLYNISCAVHIPA